MLDVLNTVNEELLVFSDALPEWLRVVMVCLIAVVLGSYSNSVIYRTPLKLMAQFEQYLVDNFDVKKEKCGHLVQWEAFSKGGARSQCTSCGDLIRSYDNIPILSYILLMGRCRSCGDKFSLRYVVVEALVMGLGVASFLVLFDATFSVAFMVFIAIILSCVFIAFIDLSTRTISDFHSNAYVFLTVTFFVISPIGNYIELKDFVEVCAYLVGIHLLVNVPLAKIKGIDTAIGEGDVMLLVVGAALCSAMAKFLVVYPLPSVFSFYLLGIGGLGLGTAVFYRGRDSEIPAAPSILLINGGMLSFLVLAA